MATAVDYLRKRLSLFIFCFVLYKSAVTIYWFWYSALSALSVWSSTNSLIDSFIERGKVRTQIISYFLQL